MIIIVDDLLISHHGSVGEIHVYGKTLVDRILHDLRKYRPKETVHLFSNSDTAHSRYKQTVDIKIFRLNEVPAKSLEAIQLNTRFLYSFDENQGPKSIFEIQDDRDIKKAKKILLSRVNKAAAPTKNFPLRLLYRPLGGILLPSIANTNITPNQITVLTVLLSTLSAFFLSYGDFSWALVGVLTMQLAHGLDCVDGRLARLKQMSSTFGQYIDSLADIIKINIFYLGMALFTFAREGSSFIWILMFLVLLVDYVLYYAQQKAPVTGSLLSHELERSMPQNPVKLWIKKCLGFIPRLLCFYEGRLFMASVFTLLQLEAVYFTILLLFLGREFIKLLRSTKLNLKSTV